MKIQLVDSSNSIITGNTTNIFSTKSGETVLTNYRVGIFDKVGIIDIKDIAYGFINLTENNQEQAKISKNTVAQPANGVLIFNDFIISAPPDSVVEMEVIYEDIDANKLEILGFDRELAVVIFNIFVQQCSDGEIIIDEVI